VRIYLIFGILRSFVLAFFSLATLKSVMEFNNWDRSPLAAGGGGGAPEAGGGGGGGGAAVTVEGRGGGGGAAVTVGGRGGGDDDA